MRANARAKLLYGRRGAHAPLRAVSSGGNTLSRRARGVVQHERRVVRGVLVRVCETFRRFNTRRWRRRSTVLSRHFQKRTFRAFKHAGRERGGVRIARRRERVTRSGRTDTIKAESVSLVWAIAEAECGKWERP